MPSGSVKGYRGGLIGTAILVAVTLLLGLIHSREIDSLPRHIPPDWSPDARHLRLADHVLADDGLGPYNADTLRDRPGYAFFLARAAELGLGERRLGVLLRLVGCLLLGSVLLRLGVHPLLALGAAALSLFSPALLGTIGQRLAPETLHASLSLVIVGGLLQAALTDRVGERLMTLVAVGPILAIDVLTTADWQRLLPIVAAALLLPFFRDRRLGNGSAVKRLALGLVILSLPALVTVARFESGHQNRYGVGVLSDEDDPDFLAALGALERIATAGRDGRLDRDLRAQLYQLAPSFARLRSAFESELYSGPARPEDDHGRPAALRRRTVREAAARLGLYDDPEAARDFYRQLGAELNAAVDDRLIDGLSYPLLSDRPGFEFSAFSLFWLRLGELWNLQFEDLLPGDAWPRMEATAEEIAIAEEILGDLPQARATFEDEALRREGRLMLYRRVLPGLFLLAFIGTLMRSLAADRRRFDRTLNTELTLLFGLSIYLIALCSREDGWLIDQGRGFLPLHLIAPFWLAMGLAHHQHAVSAVLDDRSRRMAGLLLGLLLLFGLVVVVFLPARAAEREARPLFVGAEGFVAVLEGEGAHLEDGLAVLPGPGDRLRIRLSRDAAADGPRLLIFEAEVSEARSGDAFEIQWSGPARDERGGRRRQLFVKDGERRQSWAIAIDPLRLGDLEIRAPESLGFRVRPLDCGFRALTRPFRPGPDPLPEVSATRWRPDEVEIRVIGGERESRYEFFLSGGVSETARIYPERSGELGLADSLGLHGADGEDLRLILVTDAAGDGALRTRIETPDTLPDRLFIQGLGTQHFTSRPIECDKRY